MVGLAFSTNAFKKNTITEAVDAIAEIGYPAVEIMADVPHALPATFGPPDRIALKQQLATRKLTVSNVNAFTLFACGDTYHPTWIEDDAALRQSRIDHTVAAIELAADIGAKTVSLQPGGPLIGTTLTCEEAARRFARGLEQVLPIAKKFGVILAVEPEPGLFIESSREYLEFKNNYFRNEPLLKMNCDIGHLFCVGEDPAEVIRRMNEHIAHVHLEDIGENRVHQHLTPGKGAIDFPSVFDALDKIGYTGRVTVELYPYETTAAGVARAAWDYLKKMT
ncbi:MAG TPA: sugar phosphate isomerase/epimerase [Tepidisphaeraceae bacterium]|nr:sugar phosphate isomerase/epimerase [Tepidisphaeraceae bacterium]